MSTDITKSPVVIVTGASFILFELMKTYHFNAPSLATARAASNEPGSEEYHDVLTQLNDTDKSVGSIALVISLVFSITTNDYSIFILTLVCLGLLSFWRRNALHSTPTTQPR